MEPGEIGEMAKLVVLLAAGMTDGAIARKLGVSERTVRRRVADLLTHLGAASRFQAGVLLSTTHRHLLPSSATYEPSTRHISPAESAIPA